jgi:hypothetical protein
MCCVHLPAPHSALPDGCIGGYHLENNFPAPLSWRDEASEDPFLQGRSGMHRKEGFGI